MFLIAWIHIFMIVYIYLRFWDVDSKQLLLSELDKSISPTPTASKKQNKEIKHTGISKISKASNSSRNWMIYNENRWENSLKKYLFIHSYVSYY